MIDSGTLDDRDLIVKAKLLGSQFLVVRPFALKFLQGFSAGYTHHSSLGEFAIVWSFCSTHSADLDSKREDHEGDHA